MAGLGQSGVLDPVTGPHKDPLMLSGWKESRSGLTMSPTSNRLHQERLGALPCSLIELKTKAPAGAFILVCHELPIWV